MIISHGYHDSSTPDLRRVSLQGCALSRLKSSASIYVHLSIHQNYEYQLNSNSQTTPQEAVAKEDKANFLILVLSATKCPTLVPGFQRCLRLTLRPRSCNLSTHLTTEDMESLASEERAERMARRLAGFRVVVLAQRSIST